MNPKAKRWREIKLKTIDLEFKIFTEPFLILNSELESQCFDGIFEDIKPARYLMPHQKSELLV